MVVYRFMLVLRQPPTHHQAATVTGAHEDIHLVAGTPTAAAHRQTVSLAVAVASVILDLESFGLHPIEVHDHAMTTLDEVADTIGQPRDLVEQWATRRHGPGRFPPPITNRDPDSSLYPWTAVRDWLRTHIGLDLPDTKPALAAMNHILHLRHLVPLLTDLHAYQVLLPAEFTGPKRPLRRGGRRRAR